MIPEDHVKTAASALIGQSASDSILALAALSVPKVPSWITEMSAIKPGFGLSLAGVGFDVEKHFGSTAISPLASAGLLGDNYMSAMEKLGLDTIEFMDTPIMDLDATIGLGNFWKSDKVFADAMATLGASVASSMDTSYVQDLIDQADAFAADIAAFDIDDRSAELFSAHPDLVESIEQQPFLINLSPADRKLIVWFIGTIVAIYVTMSVANISLDSDELDALLSGLGIAGPAAGVAAGKLTGKLLDKLPQADS
jgi:hypothetical protein